MKFEEIKNNKMIDSDENMVLEFNYSYSNRVPRSKIICNKLKLEDIIDELP